MFLEKYNFTGFKALYWDSKETFRGKLTWINQYKHWKAENN
jgi:hypothetical protein